MTLYEISVSRRSWKGIKPVNTCRITIPNAYTSASLDTWHLVFRNMDGDNNSGAMNGVVPPPWADVVPGPLASSYAIVMNPKSARRARTGLSEVTRMFACGSTRGERAREAGSSGNSTYSFEVSVRKIHTVKILHPLCTVDELWDPSVPVRLRE